MKPFVIERFSLNHMVEDRLRSLIPPFGYNGFGEFIFYRTYSRIRRDGGQEDWADCVIRVTNGTFSIRKDWYIKNHIAWDEYFWQQYAENFALSMYSMFWLPPGRGMWAMGSDFVYERGSMALYNCAYTDITTKEMSDDISWLMDSLMHGVGVGFGPERDDKLRLHNPQGTFEYVIPDSREGWCISEKLLIDAYMKPGRQKPKFVYDEIRDAGLPIKGFGGISSGPKPLMELHRRTEAEFERYMTRPEYDSVYLKANLANHTGCCVVAGNVRRSAELAKGKVTDATFLNLKDYSKYPEREAFGWMCLDRNTWIGTSEGPKQVWELYQKPFKARVSGQDYESRGFFSGGEKQCVRLTAQGYTLDCSVDHKIMTPKGWVKAGELSVGDSLTLNGEGLKEGWWAGEGSFDEGYVLGVLVGDGSISEDGHCHISSSMRDPGSESVRNKFSQAMSSLRLPCGKWINPPTKVESEELRLSCASLVDLASEYGIRHGNKTVTDVVERASSAFCVAFLRGLFDTDGSVEKLGRYGTTRGLRLSQSDLTGLQAVQRILSRLNIQSRITEVTGSIWSKKRCYVLTIRSENVNWFASRIGFSHARKWKELGIARKAYQSKLKLTARVDSVEQLPPTEMFDCTVEELHAYDANGIYVSNSNNSVELETDEDFQMLGEIAQRVIRNGEPGYINRRNMPYGRIGKRLRGLRKDRAVGFNPCGEIPLEHREVCNVAETLPTMCPNHATWLQACEYATVYMSTVSLLPTHQPSTNRVVARNRRVGASIIDYSGWKLANGVHKVTRYMREGYKRVRATNKWVNQEAGIPISIRNTTIKPGGTGPKLPGKTAGIGHPNFDYTLRRVRVAKNSPVHRLLVEAGVPYEGDYFDKYTDVFEWPIFQGPAKPAEKVTLWEQAMNLITVQREWADNAVSNTLNFRPMWPLVEFIDSDFHQRVIAHIGNAAWYQIQYEKLTEYYVPERWKIRIKWTGSLISEISVHEYDPNHEEDDIEPVLSALAPVTKSVSLLPHSAKGAYRQMPEEGISRAEYEQRLASIAPIDWSRLSGSDGIDERYCSGQSCEIIR